MPFTLDDMQRAQDLRTPDGGRAASYPTEYIVSLHSDPVWQAIWETIKRWDINTPAYGGYCGANGDHVTQIYEAVKAAGK